jgi:hypothetical protein
MGLSLVEEMLENEHRQTTAFFPFPPLDLSTKLIDAYFEHWNDSQCPLLHRPSFDRAVAAGMIDSNASFRSLGQSWRCSSLEAS